jgi:hypothetical protein
VHDPCFYRRLDDDLYEATRWTRGPWSRDHQHAGPPSALVAGQLEAMLEPPFRCVRVAVEVTRQVPIGKLRVDRSFRRDGRSVKALTGRLLDDEGSLVLSADVLAIAEASLGFDPMQPAMDEPLPENSAPVNFPFRDEEPSYANAIELRFGRGEFGSGDVMAWLRMRVPLVEGVMPSPLERVLTAADSGNGVSQRMNISDYTFVNPDLTVTLHRELMGEWVGMAARTEVDARGIGVADTRLYDESGPVGRGVQTLLVRKRP